MPRIDPDTLELEEQVIRTNKVSKTHKGGRSLSWNVLVAVGDRGGHVGVGLGKAAGIPDAIRKGIESAKKSLIEVPIVGTTVPHETEQQFGAALVRMKPASPGTGVVAGGAVRPILELAGIRDVLAKSLGSPNAINTAWATMECLKSMKIASEVEHVRGKPLAEMVPWLARKLEEETSAEPASEETADEEADVDAEAEAPAEQSPETQG